MERFEKKADIFNTHLSLVVFLKYEHAKKFLKDDVTEEGWNKDYIEYTKENVIKEMREYMEFAWDKASNHRGLSANRSITHFTHWLWLLEDDELLNIAEDGTNYAQYGCPILMQICDKYDLPVPDDEGIRRMARGEYCKPGCTMGCGQ